MSERREIKPGMNARILTEEEQNEWFSVRRAFRKATGEDDDSG